MIYIAITRWVVEFDKNSLWDELNIRKRELYVKKKIPSMITDSNQVHLAKMTGRRLQEVLNRRYFQFIEIKFGAYC
jgi:hypothetical protein